MRKELIDMGGLMEPLLKVAAGQATEKTAAETEKKILIDTIHKAMKNWHYEDISDVASANIRELLKFYQIRRG